MNIFNASEFFGCDNNINYSLHIAKLNQENGPVHNPDNYPLNHFPLPLQAAIMEVYYTTRAPIPLIAASALGALSLAQQARLNILTPYGATVPCSLYLVTLAESGERKTTCDHFFLAKMREKHTLLYQKDFQPFEAYQTEMTAWRKRPPAASEDPPPKKAWLINMISSNITPATITQNLSERCPFGSLMSNEAGTVLQGQAPINLYLLNTLWDGGPIEEERKSSKPIKVEAPRFTLSLMLQPQVFLKFTQRHGDLSEASGFLPRSLVAQPQSTQGMRPSTNLQNISKRAITELQDKMASWLEQSWEGFLAQQPPTTVNCTPQAEARWWQFANGIEQQLGMGGYYTDIRPFASKAAQHALRLAALFSQFQDNTSSIQDPTMDSAIRSCDWYLQEYKRLFGAQPAVSQAQLDMQAMLNFLAENCRASQQPVLSVAFVIEYASEQLAMKRTKVTTVLNMLQQNCYITIGPHESNSTDTIACLFVDRNASQYLSLPRSRAPSGRSVRQVGSSRPRIR